MYTENILKEIQDSIRKKTESLTLANVHQFREWMKPHQDILDSLSVIHSLEQSTPVETEENQNQESELPQVVEQEEKPVETDAVEEEESDDAEYDDPTYPEPYPIGRRFEFRLRAFGGSIDEINYPFSEALVRSNGYQNGNILEVVDEIKTAAGQKKRFNFKIVDETVKDNPDLGEIENGIVEMDGTTLIVKRTTNGLIRDKDENGICFFPRLDDVRRFSLREGDIINGRYYLNNITSTFRVTHKHEYQVDTPKSVDERVREYRQANPSESEPGEKMIDRIDFTDFQNRYIVLLGLPSSMPRFTEALADQGFEFVHISPDEHKMRLRKQIQKADMLLIATVENSHESSKYAAHVANQYEIPFTSTHETGLTGIFNDARKLLDK